jgi:hypothetical protein
MKFLIMTIAGILATTLYTRHLTAANKNLEPQAAYNHLATLKGVWQVKDSAGALKVQFEQTAGNSVLLETWWKKGKKHSLTIYHLDGDRLMATHYCPQGNQPRLQMKQDSSLNNIAFEFFDATNLKKREDLHQHFLAFDLSKADKMVERTEIYRKGQIENTDSLLLFREQTQ